MSHGKAEGSNPLNCGKAITTLTCACMFNVISLCIHQSLSHSVLLNEIVMIDKPTGNHTEHH